MAHTWHMLVAVTVWRKNSTFASYSLAAAVILDNFQSALKKRKASKIKQINGVCGTCTDKSLLCIPLPLIFVIHILFQHQQEKVKAKGQLSSSQDQKPSLLCEHENVLQPFECSELLASEPQTDGFVKNTLELVSKEEDTSGRYTWAHGQE